MFRYSITFVLVTLFTGVCVAQEQDKPTDPTALSTAEKFVEAQKKVANENAGTAAKIEAVTLMPLNALMSAKDFKNALDILKADVDELAQKPDGKEIPVVRYDIIVKQIDEIANKLDKRDMFGSLKQHLVELQNIFEEVAKDITVREKAINEATQLQKDVNNMVEKRNRFLEELQRLEKAGKLSADFMPDDVKITPPKEAVVITSDNIEDETEKAKDELDNAINREITNLVEKGNRLIASIENVGRLDDWANLLFVKLLIKKASEAEFQNTLLKVLSSTSEEKLVNDKLTFLHDYYTGLVKEHFGKTDEARQAFIKADSVATVRQDRIRATSKLAEMQTLLAEK
jgi:hypothetical protein